MKTKSWVLILSCSMLSVLTFQCGDNSSESTPCYLLNIETVGWGDVTASPSAQCYEEGTQITLTATADQGWVFDGWENGASGSTNPLTLTMGSSAMTVGARFELVDYYITTSIVPDGAGSIDFDPDQTAYHLNDIVALTALPSSGYFFDRWSGDTASTLDTITLEISDDVSIDANFIGSGPDSVTLIGTISWPGHTLSYPVLVLFDIDFNIQAAWLVTGGAESVDFEVKFSIDDVPDSYIHAVDDLDNDLIIFETGEPWSCYDPDGNLYCNYLYYSSGEIYDDVDIELYSGGLQGYDMEPVRIER